ncbi:MAG: dual specificity protein phosphatase family protein [Desulfovibrionaceae bacterium]
MARASSQAYALDWVTDQLAVGQAPMSMVQLESLRSQGIGAILNLCGEFCDLHEIEAEEGFEVYYLPLQDEEAPDLTALERALDWLDEAIYLGKKVLIHCRHGIGRTGTVLNAYLLRRGLGHRMAGRKLKPLKSKPANFQQWWAIRKYGRQSGQLTVREPSLEFRHLVDLGPFFADYEALVVQAEDLAAVERADAGRCGRKHQRCCTTPVRLQLAEAAFLTQRMNRDLGRDERLVLINRAVAVAKRERAEEARIRAEDPDGETCLRSADAVCPLLDYDQCQLFESRPLQCRTYELPAEVQAEFWDTVLAPSLTRLSEQLFFAFTSSFPEAGLPTFALPDVISGRYVQTLFHAMLNASRRN